MKKTAIALAMIAASSVSQAATLNANSTYDISVNAAGSCFAFGDCTTLVDNVTAGSSISIATTDDGAGGVNFTVTSASDMLYTGTPGGLFTTTQIGGSGSIDASGNVSYTPTGRLGAAEFFAYLGTPAWNVADNGFTNDTAGAYVGFTSGSMTNINPADGTGATAGLTLTGSALDDSLNAVIVSVSNVGTAWGSFGGTPYSEVWNVSFTETSAVPVPAAVWLFGSGLVGLAGVARRRKAA